MSFSLKPGQCTTLLSVMLFSSALGRFAIAAPPSVRIFGHLPPLEAQSMILGRVDSHQVLNLALTLPLRNVVEMNNLIGKMYNPNDPLYRQFLSPVQFKSLFCPAQSSYDAVRAWAESSGMRVVGTHRNRTILDVEGTVGAIEHAFDLHINSYLAPNGRVFRAPDQDPASPPVPLTGVIGLDDLIVLHPHNIPRGNGMINPNGLTPYGNGTGPGGGLAPADIKKAYNLSGVTQNGSGQTLGLFELDGYLPSDISHYESYFSLKSTPLHNVLIDGYNGSAGSGTAEVTLDIELMTAIAGGASKIIVYEGPNTGQGVLDTYQRIANDNLAHQISTSWGLAENYTGYSFATSEKIIFAQMLLQGQSIYAASGDSGAYDNGSTLSVDDPASQLYMTATGGTTLTTNGSGGSWKSEATWSGSGGGISSFWNIPVFQNGFISSSSGGSTTMRNVPDVSLNADPNTGYAVYVSGGWNVYGGTSCAAPLWAAFTSLVNQARVALQKPVLGFPNPSLYAVAKSSGYSADFHDIYTGNNQYYNAVTGYDDATGLGTFNGANLLLALTNAIPPIAKQLIGNPGFEKGSSNPAPWVVSVSSIINNSSLEPPHSGHWDAWLDGRGAAATQTLSQTVTIPSSASAAALSFYLHIDTKHIGSTKVDSLTLQLVNPATKAVIKTLAVYYNTNAQQGYSLIKFNMYPYIGKSIMIKLTGIQKSSVNTSFVVDDFALKYL